MVGDFIRVHADYHRLLQPTGGSTTTTTTPEGFDEEDYWGSDIPGSLQELMRSELFRQCHKLETGTNREFSYRCLHSEYCCDAGCCMRADRKLNTQFWYFWFVVTVVAAMSLACYHYYRKQREREQRMTRDLRAGRGGASLYRQERRRQAGLQVQAMDTDEFVSFWQQHYGQVLQPQPPQVPPPIPVAETTPAPPSYETLMHVVVGRVECESPRSPRFEVKDDESPPAYVDACKLLMADPEDPEDKNGGE